MMAQRTPTHDRYLKRRFDRAGQAAAMETSQNQLLSASIVTQHEVSRQTGPALLTSVYASW